MRFHPMRQRPDWIVYRDDYYPDRIEAIRRVPGARFVGWAWIFPASAWPAAVRALGLRPAHAYPYLTRFIPRFLTNLQADIAEERLVLTGPADAIREAIGNLHVLCGYEVPEVTRRNQPAKPQPMTLLDVRVPDPGRAVVQFPRGLRHRIAQFLKLAGATVQVRPLSPPPAPSIEVAAVPELRDYQQAAVQEAIERRMGTLVMPTGAGKTRTAAGIIAALRQRTLFLVQSRDLVRQTVRSFQALLGVPVGVLYEGRVRLRDITVATVQSLLARTAEGSPDREKILAWLEGVQLLIVDEGHGLGAETVYAAAMMCRPAYAFALTATPQREDRREVQIEAATGPAWRPKGCTDAELVARGYLLPVRVTCVPFVHGTQKTRRTPAAQFAAAIAQNAARNHLLLRLARMALTRYQTLILVKTKDHGELLASRLGVPFVHGAIKERAEIFDAFARGELRGLVATPLLEQGVDIPAAECLIDAVPRRSTVKILQTIGRVRRPAPGKTVARVVTLIDLDGGAFERASARKLDIYDQAGFEVAWLDPVTLRPSAPSAAFALANAGGNAQGAIAAQA